MTLLEDVKSIVTTRMRDIEAVDEDLLDMAVEETQLTILNYCNLNTIPKGLKFTWANMAEDVYRFHASKGETGTDSVNMEDVSQLKIGDTTIQLDRGKNASSISKAHRPNLDFLIMNYRQQLNQYRRMVW